MLGLIVQFELHHFPNFLRLRAVHCKHEGLFQERVLDVRQVAIQGNDAFPPCLVRVADDLFDEHLGIFALIEEDVSHPSKRGGHDSERELNHHRAEGSAKHNHGGGGLENLRHLAALEKESEQNSADRKKDADEGALVHGSKRLGVSLSGFRFRSRQKG